MKYDIKKLLGWFATASLLLTTSCVDASLDEIGSGLTDEVTVSFVLAPESAATSRAGEEEEKPDAKKPARISDGSKADMLIYAVYDKDDNLLLGYSDGVDEELASELGITHGDGQTIKKIDQFPTTVKLTLKRGETYKVAFWAQSRNTKAYNTKDLKKVEVIYTAAPDDGNGGNGGNDGNGGTQTLDANGTLEQSYNNDEMRDVFCRTVVLKAGQSGKLEQNVYLYRPLAQINVGTTGYDYELVMRNANVKYTHSKIRINRVARYLDVVNDRTITSTTKDEYDDDGNIVKAPEAFAVIDFAYAPIPAYVHESFGGKAPEYPSYTKWDWLYAGTYEEDGEKKWNFTPGDNVKYEDYAYEEFLYVPLYEEAEKVKNKDKYVDDNYGGWDDEEKKEIGDDLSDYANINNFNDKLTETFKYLSMCYILTSSSKEEAVVINNIKVWLASDANGSNEYELLHIDHVPAQRNWRTNIVGNLLTEANTFEVTLDRNFAGEYNGELDRNDEEFGAKWSGPLADGVFYDAYADEIQISNANGLLWFQRMVNGDMKVREKYNNKQGDAKPAEINDTYLYFKEIGGVYSDKPVPFTYTGISAPDGDDKLKERILKATKMEEWPAAKNFHFVSSKGEQVTVALMADIDLSGIEWIPIGFDGRIAETVKKEFEESDATNRGFYGKFKGNGHTIYNMKTKRFSAQIPEEYMQLDGSGPYDNMQWFARGLFGMVGGNAEIDGVKLINPDVLGCQCVGAVVGAAQGDAIKITNCVVDGGSLVVTPLYRGDQYGTKNRTFARGTYLGGIVGYFNTVGGRVDNCEVKNVYMRGYRRVGGIVGSINPKDLGDTPDNNMGNIRESKPASISYNKISNTVLLASQFSTFGLTTIRNYNDSATSDSDKKNNERSFNLYLDKYEIIKIGFGWDEGQYNLYAHEIVGGHQQDDPRIYLKEINPKFEYDGNDPSGLTFSKLTEEINDDHKRVSDIHELPLQYMPMLSAWYTDIINLQANYYGEPSAYTQHKLTLFNMFSSEADNSGYNTTTGKLDGDIYNLKGTAGKYYNMVKFPMSVPNKVDVDWVESSPRVGVYVGSVTINGQGVGARSVITPFNVFKEGAAAMFVCPENRHQYSKDVSYKEDPNRNLIKQNTVLNDLVLRGSPYAYTGLLMAPNKNMYLLQLNDVAIYDVYQTIATYDWKEQGSEKIWPNTITYDAGKNVGNAMLELNDCNLRGYTIPGPKWKSITYNRTTFERGTPTGHGEDEYTCVVETNNTADPGKSVPTEITFNNCFFKAPYIIDMTDQNNKLDNITFTECTATSASDKPQPIDLSKEDRKGTNKIRILSNEYGDAIVRYYKVENGTETLLAQDGEYDDGTTLPEDENN